MPETEPVKRATVQAPFQSRALYEAIADHLRECILTHELAAGSAIDEAGLAASYGVSRTPVREALKVLIHEGLLSCHIRRGTSVTRLDAAECQEAVALHALLLAQCEQAGDAKSSTPPSKVLLLQLLQITERRMRLAQGPAAQAPAQR